jgi:3',5'-nucleoside bisphosphate phosphatase
LSTGTQPSFDLQSHSTQSDGELAPAAVVSSAADAGVQLLALTDHDSVEGVPEATVAASEHGVALVPATEISTVDVAGADLHVVGYLVDPADRPLRDQLAASRGEREGRAQQMVDSLKEFGYAVDEQPLEARRQAGESIGRPHIAQAVVSHPNNAERLQREGLLDRTKFLVAYLIEGKPAFTPRLGPSVAEAIDLIHGAGGVAVWAHPFWDIADAEGVLSTLDRFVAWGLDGVEAFYVTHTQEQTELLVRRCGELGLLTTGSSDFHGPEHKQFRHFRAFETYGLTPNLGPIAPQS